MPANAEALPLWSVTALSRPPVDRKVVGSVIPCRTIATQMVPVTRMDRYMHMPKPKV